MLRHLNSVWPRAKRVSPAATPLVSSSSGEEAEPSDVGSVIRDPVPKSWRRLNLFNLAILVVGSAAIAAIFVFLVLLWEQSLAAVWGSGGSSFLVLQHILASSWAPTTITISTAALRVIIAAQAGAFTSMAAALILERVGITVSNAPFYSVSTALQPPPHNLLGYMVRGLAGAGRKSRPWRNSPSPIQAATYALIMVEIAATIASQFLSTLMISDFANETAIFRGLVDPSIAVYSSYGGRAYIDNNYWSMPVEANWRFAEAAPEEEEGPFINDEEGIDDTGRALRAFLPFEDEQQRVSLREYEGPTDVLDFRVVCVRPALSDLLVQLSGQLNLVLAGKLDINASYSMLKKTPYSTEPVSFACPSAALSAIRGGDAFRLTSICFITDISQAYLDAPHVLPGADDTDQYLIIDATYKANLTHLTNKLAHRAARTDGSWATIATHQGDEMMRVTACLFNQQYKTLSVKISSAQDDPEPGMPWSHEQNTYNTTDSRRQLGVISAEAPPSPQHNRGILALNNSTEWGKVNVTKLGNPSYITDGNPGYYQDIMKFGMYEQGESCEQCSDSTNYFIFLSNTSASNNNAIAHRTHFALFQETLRGTGSPARALQAIFMRITQMIFYDSLRRSKPLGRATAIFSTPALLPVRRLGLLSSAAIVATHLCALFITTALFLLRTDKSELGQLWQALAHVVNDDTLPVLRRAAAGDLRDRDVRKLARSESPDVPAAGGGDDAILTRRKDGTVTLKVGCKGDTKVVNSLYQTWARVWSIVAEVLQH